MKRKEFIKVAAVLAMAALSMSLVACGGKGEANSNSPVVDVPDSSVSSSVSEPGVATPESGSVSSEVVSSEAANETNNKVVFTKTGNPDFVIIDGVDDAMSFKYHEDEANASGNCVIGSKDEALCTLTVGGYYTDLSLEDAVAEWKKTVSESAIDLTNAEDMHNSTWNYIYGSSYDDFTAGTDYFFHMSGNKVVWATIEYDKNCSELGRYQLESWATYFQFVD